MHSFSGAEKFTYRFPTTPVPAQETNYYCMAIQLPSDKPYHLIASNPVIDNIEVIHHIIIYGCAGIGMYLYIHYNNIHSFMHLDTTVFALFAFLVIASKRINC